MTFMYIAIKSLLPILLIQSWNYKVWLTSTFCHSLIALGMDSTSELNTSSMKQPLLTNEKKEHDFQKKTILIIIRSWRIKLCDAVTQISKHRRKVWIFVIFHHVSRRKWHLCKSLVAPVVINAHRYYNIYQK